MMSVPTLETDNIKTPNICINHDFDITPQLAISAFSVLQRYCNAISSHECITCAFYSVCEDFFTRCPGDQGGVISELQRK